jgi:hypothetical protein
MIIDHEVEITLAPAAKKHFLDLGYSFAAVKPRTKVLVRSIDLLSGSSVPVRYLCDVCGSEFAAKYFTLAVKERHLCRSCAQLGKTPLNKIDFSDRQREQIRRLYEDEWKESNEIAILLDVSGPTVRKFLIEDGVFRKNRGLPPNRECPVCSTRFRKGPSELRPVNCCSKACRGIFTQLWVERSCEHCGAAYRTKPWANERRFCSGDCWYKHNTRGAWTTCETCASPLWSTPTRPRSFCSKQCFGIANMNGIEQPCASCGTRSYKPKCHIRHDLFFCSTVCYFDYRDSNQAYREALAERISAGIVERWATDVEWATDQRERLSRQALDTIERWQGQGSKLEFLVHQMLDEMGVRFERWKRVRPAAGGAIKEFDVYFPDTDAYLEIHGGFWHADPRIFDDRTALSHVQRQNVANDDLKRSLIESELERPLHVLWEHDVHADPVRVRAELQAWGR